VALGVPGRLRPRIFSTFSTTRVAGHQPNAPAAFTPGEIPGTHFQRLSRPQGTWFCQKESWKTSHVTPPGIDPGTIQLVVQCLNHYATPGPTHTRDISLYLHSAHVMSDTPNLQSFNRGRSVFAYINILLLHSSLLAGILIQLSITQNNIF
jgi:hypothetical protein